MGTEPYDDTIKLDLFLSLQEVSMCTVGLQAAVLNMALTNPRVGSCPGQLSSQGETQTSLKLEVQSLLVQCWSLAKTER